MKLFVTFYLVLSSLIAFSQQSEGAIKTKNGYLIYFNNGYDTFTINLEGDCEIESFPFIKLNNDWIQFTTAKKNEFGNEAQKILLNYMLWELEYIKESQNINPEHNHYLFEIKNFPANLWKIKTPPLETEDNFKPVVAIYFLDFINKGLIFRLSYASTSGNDYEANEILEKFMNTLKFYTRNLDLNKLQENIMKGQNYLDY